MPGDFLRLVTFPAPWFERARPTLLRDLLDGETYIAEGGSPQLAPGEHNTGNITYDSPYAGEFATLDRHQNSRLSVVLRVMGPDPVAECDRIVAGCLSAPKRSAVEWKRDGTGVPTFFPLRGDVNWTPAYRMRERRQGGGMTVALGFEVAPFVHRGSMDVADDFSQDSIGDYALLAGTGLAVTTGALRPTDASQKRLAHTGRGYLYGDVQVTSEVVYGSTVVSNEGPPAVKILDPQNAIFATYDGALAIYKMDNNVLTSLANVAVTAPAASARRWPRLRIEGNVLTAEWWTAAPTPMGAPAATVSYTLTGADATKFGAGVQGQAGIWYWTPHASLTSYVDSLTIEPYTYRNRTLPAKIALGGKVPGDIPALCDLQLTHSGGASAPVYGLAGWAPRRTPAAGSVAPLGIIEAESATGLVGLTVTADAAARGGSKLAFIQNTAPVALWRVDGATVAEPGAETVEVDVYARVELSAAMGAVSELVLSSVPAAGVGAERFSDRGRAGYAAVIPSTGSAWRLVRLGRLVLPAAVCDLRFIGAWISTATFALDYLFCVPANEHVSSPRSLPVDVSYPKLFGSVAETMRVLRADGSGLIGKPPAAPIGEHGMGGRIEVGPGDTDLAVAASTTVPGDPTASTASQQLSHQATVHPTFLPRFHLA